MDEVYDVFISYPRKHLAEVEPIKDALEAEGLRVWFDTNDIQDYESITTSIAEGVANSKVLLAYYAAEYPKRLACQWELTVAFLAAQRKGDASARVLVVNPEAITTHIHPVELRDALFWRAPAPGDAEALGSLVRSVQKHLTNIQDTLGDTQPLTPQQWYGWRGAGSRRFVGRFAEMWEVHSGLHQAEAASITGTAAPGLAQVHGLGGIGKSLLAEEYALRFGFAYPGGVFWLRAYGHDHTHENLRPEDREVQRDGQLRDIAAELGLDVAGRSTKQVEGALKEEIGRRGQPCLWVVDDVPSELNNDGVRRWFSPHPLAKTLLTTRSRNFGSIAVPVALDVLPEDDAYQLLTTHRRPEGPPEEAAARALIQKLGCHSLAVDVAGALLKEAAGHWTFATLLADMDRPDEDVLEIAEALRLDLPNNHEVSIATTLWRSIDQLQEAGKDFLRLASVVASSPIPAGFVADVLGAVDDLDERASNKQAIVATSRAETLSLCERSRTSDQAVTWTVHALISRTMRFKDSQPQRRERVKQAAVGVLSSVLRDARDPAVRRTYATVVPHALKVAGEPANTAEAGLLGLVAQYERERGAYSAAERLYRRHLDVLLHARASEAQTLTSKNNLAMALRDVGRLVEAEELQGEVVREYTRIHGQEAYLTLNARNNYAGILETQGRLREALSENREILDIRRNRLGEDHLDTAVSKHGVARILGDLGEHGSALVLLNEVYGVRKRERGEFHSDTLITLSNIAVTLQALGRTDEALPISEWLLDHYKKTLEENHPRIFRMTSNLAVLLTDYEEYEQAKKLLTEALEHQKRIYGEAHEITLGTMNNLVGVLKSVPDLERAHSVVIKALRLSSAHLGKRHPRTLSLITTRAEILRARGEKRRARKASERVLELYRSEFGDEAFKTLLAMNNLATLMNDLGDTAEAQALLHQGLITAGRQWGVEHTITTTLAWNLYRYTTASDSAFARSIFVNYLSWVCRRDTNALSRPQREVRAQICQADTLGALG